MPDVPDATIRHPSGNVVTVNGTKLWVEREGAGEPLVLLVGGPANSHVSFHPVFSELSNQFEVVYYDYRGRGKSERPSDLHQITFEQDVEDLEGLRQALGMKQISLYGFSYGGMIAQAYALKHPENVRRLVFTNTVHSAEMWGRNHENINRELQNQYPEIWQEVEALRTRGLTSSSPEMQRLFAVHGRIVRWYNPDHASRLLSEPGSRNEELYWTFAGNDIDFVIAGEVAKLPDFRPRLKELKMPVLILAGRFDRALYPKLQMQFKHFCPQARFVMLEKSGTWGHLEEPEIVMPLLRGFLK